MPRKIELLSPARDAATAREAILHGADAVYIGAPKYSARVAAGNTIEEIASLVKFAHLYDVKIYVALNTIIKEDEIFEVESIIKSLYDIGVDALIVQDMGILKMNIPPIQLHASTQCHNTTAEQVEFLHKSGFSQVVLARELNIEQISQICAKTDVPIEVFIHGALCVSYSGRCYLSCALNGRSANRGECAQSCRMSYNLIDANGNYLIKDKHLLSLKDMNRSNSIEALLDAGVTSLKIEGRLKGTEYVKNITAYYRGILDEIFSRRSEYQQASSGQIKVNFTPNPQKSFNRGFTPYYVGDKTFENIASPYTPKSIGEKVAVVTKTTLNYIQIDAEQELHNGDGLCYITKQGEFSGFAINNVEGDRIYPSTMQTLSKGDILYRNRDIKFDKQLSSPTSERKIPIKLKLEHSDNTLLLKITDDKSTIVEVRKNLDILQLAKTEQEENQKKQLAKLGNTPFYAQTIDCSDVKEYFIPSSQLADIRREAIEKLIEKRVSNYQRPTKGVDLKPNYHKKELTFEENVSNTKACEFYKERGVETIEKAYELSPVAEAPLMTTKHCIRRTFGKCLKTKQGADWESPLYLTCGNTKIELDFNCKECKMQLIKR